MHSWKDMSDFLNCGEIELIGYQAYPLYPVRGFMYFQHSAKGCDTTLTLPPEFFLELFPSPVKFLPFEVGSDPACKGYCLTKENLLSCQNPNCRGTVLRDLLQLIQQKLKYKPAS
jgi:hypothetical protein